MQNGFEAQARDSSGKTLSPFLGILLKTVEIDLSREVMSIDLLFGRISWLQSRVDS